MLLALIFPLVLQAGAPLPRTHAAPWVDVGVRPTVWMEMLRDVSLCIASDGALVSSCSRINPRAASELCISRSTDSGRTWKPAVVLEMRKVPDGRILPARTSAATLRTLTRDQWLLRRRGTYLWR